MAGLLLRTLAPSTIGVVVAIIVAMGMRIGMVVVM